MNTSLKKVLAISAVAVFCLTQVGIGTAAKVVRRAQPQPQPVAAQPVASKPAQPAAPTTKALVGSSTTAACHTTNCGSPQTRKR